MRLHKRLLIVGLVAGVCVGSVQAGTIRYRADLVVSKAFVGSGYPLDSTTHNI